MREFRISGIWKAGEKITHYAVHERTVNPKGGYFIDKAVKMDKQTAINLVNHPKNAVMTYLWNYTDAKWVAGEDVHVVNAKEPYLRTDPDKTERDNLAHLIDYDWVANDFI